MSVASILQTLGIGNVPRVPPAQVAEGTGKTFINQKCSPCSPCSPEKHRRAEEKRESERRETWQPGQPANPDALILEIAQTLQASPARLRALLSDDDMQDIAEGLHSQAYLLAYFRLMRSDGKQLTEENEQLTSMANGSLKTDLRHSL